MTTAAKSGPVRVGLIGLGTVAQQVHLPLITRRDDIFEIAGIVDLDPAALERTGQRWSIPPDRHYQDVESLLASEQVDALIVMNSGPHSESVITGLDNGLAVLCEKPLAYSQAEVERIHAALRHSSGSLMIGYMKTHDLAVKQAQTFIDGGQARAVDVEVVHPSETRQLLVGELAHRSKPASSASPRLGNPGVDEALGECSEQFRDLYAGVLLGSIIHEFSVLRALGTPLCSVAYAQWLRANETDTTVIISGTGPGGESITLRWYYLDRHPTYRETVHWIGIDSEVSLEFPTPYVLHAPTIATMRQSAGKGSESITYTSYRSSFEIELEQFAAIVGTAEDTLGACDEAIADVRLAQQVIKHIAAHEGVTLQGEVTSPSTD